MEDPKTKELYDQAIEAIKTCYDPEIPVNIYALGLIYDLEITPLSGAAGTGEAEQNAAAATESEREQGHPPAVEESAATEKETPENTAQQENAAAGPESEASSPEEKKPAKGSGEYQAAVIMTLTSPFCPVAGTLPEEVKEKVRSVEGIAHATVDVVFDPPWDKEMMSEEAKLQLGFM